MSRSLPEDVKGNMQVLIKQARTTTPYPTVVPVRSPSNGSINSSVSGYSDESSAEGTPAASVPTVSLETVGDVAKISPSDYENLSADIAMKLFLIGLFNAAPYWKYEQFL